MLRYGTATCLRHRHRSQGALAQCVTDEAPAVALPATIRAQNLELTCRAVREDRAVERYLEAACETAEP